MGQDIKLTASDGFKIGGYRADPAGKPRAAIVVIQEIFGVNHHIRSVCDRLAKEGYVAIAPDYFFRAGDPSPRRSSIASNLTSPAAIRLTK